MRTKKNPTKTENTPVSSTEQERQQLLHRLWLTTTDALVAKIATTPPAELDAATLQAAVKMLSANGIAVDTIASAKGEDDKHARTLRESLAGLPDVDSLDEYALPPADLEKGKLR